MATFFFFFVRISLLLLVGVGVAGSLVDAHEVLGDADVVDHLRDAEQGRDDDHAAQRALEERSWSLLKTKWSQGKFLLLLK